MLTRDPLMSRIVSDSLFANGIIKMKTWTRVYLPSFAAFLALTTMGLTANSQAIKPLQPSAVVPAQIWYSEQFQVHSAIVDEDFLIQVGKPNMAEGVKAPVLYLLDGNRLFGMAVGMLMPNRSSIIETPPYIIGIAYPAQNQADTSTRRTLDLTHVALTAEMRIEFNMTSPTGDGQKFQRFLTEELRPLIEARYPVDPHQSILAGHSLGGLFATTVLLNSPTAFDGYIIGSPSVAGNPTLLDIAQTFKAPVKTRVFIGVGGLEPYETPGPDIQAGAKLLAETLSSPSSNLDVKFWNVPDEAHGTMRPAFFMRAFETMYGPTKP